MKCRNFVLNAIRGFLIGATDVIPGVSGSTTALILKIYDKLIHSLKELTSNIFKPKHWNIDFLLPLFIGIVIALLTMSKVIPFAMNEYTNATFSFFFGLIIMAAFTLIPQIRSSKRKEKKILQSLFFLMIGLLLAFWITGIEEIQANHSYFMLFLSGIVAICAMLLPGISGSFVLLILGQYEFVFESLSMILQRFWHLTALGLGVLLGIRIFPSIIDYFLNKNKQGTMAFLVGLMIGSLRLPFNEIRSAVKTGSSPLVSFLFAFVGMFLIYFLNRISQKSKRDTWKAD